MAFKADKDACTLWIRQLLADRQEVSRLVAHAKVFGKVRADASVDEIRAIIPQSDTLILLDRVLTELLTPFVDSTFPGIPGIFSGGQPHAQVKDIGSAVWLTIEKGLDMRSSAAVAQMDIQTYFDHLPLLLICRWCERQGFDTSIIAAATSLQLFVLVLFWVGSASALVGCRTRGGFTGANLALNLSRILVESAIRALLPQLQPLGFEITETYSIAVAVWIDNVYTFSESATDATALADLIQAYLRDQWRLRIKPSSKQILVPRGAGAVETDESWEVLQKGMFWDGPFLTTVPSYLFFLKSRPSSGVVSGAMPGSQVGRI